MSISTNIQCFRSEDVTINVTMTPTTDITGWTLSFVAINSSGVTTISKTSGSGITITSPSAGMFSVSISSTDTTIAYDSYTYAIRRTDSGFNAVLCNGYFVVLRAA